MSDSIVSIKKLSIRFKTGEGMVRAVNDVSLELPRGGILGLVGESGSGKTTTALAIPQLLAANASIESGEILFEGIDLLTKSEKEMQSIRWNDISIVFQGAMNALNPLKRVGEQIAEPIRVHDRSVSRREASIRSRELLEQVGIPSSGADKYPHEFSGGMRQRVMIAMALACRPKLIIADEPVTALDVMIQAQIMELLKDLNRASKLSMLIISHDLSALSEFCDRIAVMYEGSLVETGDTRSVFDHPSHPYTVKLMNSYPNIYGERPASAGKGGGR
jgi:peptide/nickel transport system ATP-binding protein